MRHVEYMKKLLIIISVSLMSLIASAQSYRGMVELGIGVTGKGPSYSNELGTFKLNNAFLGSFTTTHGCQITPSIFVGAGVGVDMGFGDSFLTPVLGSKFNKEDFQIGSYKHKEVTYLEIPVFLDFRYDLDTRRRVTPFFDIKVGYRINSNIMSGTWAGISGPPEQEYVDKYGYGLRDCDVIIGGASSFYLKPTVGVRFNCGKNSGVNMGISCDLLKNSYCYYSYERIVGGPHYWGESDYAHWDLQDDHNNLGQLFTRWAWMFNIGFDF